MSEAAGSGVRLESVAGGECGEVEHALIVRDEGVERYGPIGLLSPWVAWSSLGHGRAWSRLECAPSLARLGRPGLG